MDKRLKYLTNVTIRNEKRNMKTNGEFYFHLRNIRLNSVSERKSCFYGSTGYLWVFFASITRKIEPEQLLLSSSFPFIYFFFLFSPRPSFYSSSHSSSSYHSINSRTSLLAARMIQAQSQSSVSHVTVTNILTHSINQLLLINFSNWK